MAHAVNNNKKRQDHITVVHNMPDLHNDPYVVEKVERARAFLKKAGLPKGWGKKKDS